ncbi:MAG: type II secretion system GspH family protein [Magnetococcus sp. YQC-5]
MRLNDDKRQAGFSLIEIAIVLVIIGLLIGGVLKGQTLVKNSKIKRIATDTTSVQGAINAYMDSYWVLPGDDAGSATRWGTAAPGGNGNGLIQGLLLSAVNVANDAATAETTHAFNHMYCEGLLKGNCIGNAATVIAHPVNPLGGITGIADGRSAAVMGLTKKMVCMKEIPSDYAMIYDTQFDDGAGDRGDIRGSANNEDENTVGGPTATPYATAPVAKILICTGF